MTPKCVICKLCKSRVWVRGKFAPFWVCPCANPNRAFSFGGKGTRSDWSERRPVVSPCVSGKEVELPEPSVSSWGPEIPGFLAAKVCARSPLRKLWSVRLWTKCFLPPEMGPVKPSSEIFQGCRTRRANAEVTNLRVCCPCQISAAPFEKVPGNCLGFVLPVELWCQLICALIGRIIPFGERLWRGTN